MSENKETNAGYSRLQLPELRAVGKWLDENRKAIHGKYKFIQMIAACRRDTGITVSASSMGKFCKEEGIMNDMQFNKKQREEQALQTSLLPKEKTEPLSQSQAILDRVRDLEQRERKVAKELLRIDGLVERVNRIYRELGIVEPGEDVK